MAGRSIGELNVKITGNAQQLVQEMQRADASVKGAVTKMDKELGQLQRSMARKFSLSDIGKDLLKGLGIGSGFALAQQAVGYIADQWREAADRAKEVEAITARIADSVQARMDARKTDEQLLTSDLEKQAKLYREMQALQSPRTATTSYTDREGNTRNITRTFAPTAEDLAQAQRLNKQIEDLQAKIEGLNRSIAEQRAKQAETGFALVERLDKENADAQRRVAEGLSRDKQRIAEEEVAYQIDLWQSEMQANEARDKRLAEDTRERMAALSEAIFGDAERSLEEVRPAMKAFESEMSMMWNSVSDRAGQMFADMVMTGKASFAQLGDLIARSVIEVSARMAIINPLLNALFGGFGGWSALPAFFGSGAAPAGGGKAIGGPVNAGVAYTVGERGREMFIPDTAGTIIPAEQTSAMLGGGGNTYIIDARGADQGAVSRIERALMMLAGPGVVERRAVSAVTDRSLRMA